MAKFKPVDQRYFRPLGNEITQRISQIYFRPLATLPSRIISMMKKILAKSKKKSKNPEKSVCAYMHTGNIVNIYIKLFKI